MSDMSYSGLASAAARVFSSSERASREIESTMSSDVAEGARGAGAGFDEVEEPSRTGAADGTVGVGVATAVDTTGEAAGMAGIALPFVLDAAGREAAAAFCFFASFKTLWSTVN